MNTRFKMAEMNSAEAAKLLRNLCEVTQANSKNWDNMEAIFKLCLDAALKAGAEYMRERAAKEAERVEESVKVVRQWQRHHLLRQFGDNGLVLPENLELSQHIERLIAAVPRLPQSEDEAATEPHD